MSRPVKCLVWDLDNTLWDGVLLEDERVTIRPGARELMGEMDGRGILQSIASKNDFETARRKLIELELWDVFLYPQINWRPKSESMKVIAESINIGIDSLALLDDEAFERDEVRFSLPQLLCLDPSNMAGIAGMPELVPRFVTDESKLRRAMYRSDINRNRAESDFLGPKEEFLATLEMRVAISRARKDDLMRAEELTLRTHQMNTTGVTYSYEQLKELSVSAEHEVLVAALEDKYGNYGRIGLALVERKATAWTIRLLLTSCRVISKGIGTMMLAYIIQRAQKAGVRLFAEFVPTGCNRVMYIAYKFAGFKETERGTGEALLQHDFERIPQFPDYAEIQFGK